MRRQVKVLRHAERQAATGEIDGGTNHPGAAGENGAAEGARVRMTGGAPRAAGPLLVGVADSAGALDRYATTIPTARTVDLVEARVDLFAAEDRPVARWRDACARLEASGTPVLATIRLHAEGGAWKGAERERLALYGEALAVASWVDVEAQSAIAAEVAAAAREAGRIAVLSHHDFARTPPLAELRAIVDGARARGAAVVKVATLVKSDADRDALLA